MNSVAIVLAAGFSSRFRGHKLKAQMKNGFTVFQQTVTNLAAATDRLVVVTQADMLDHIESSLAAALPSIPIEIIVNENSRAGMGTSIAAGVRALARTPTEGLGTEASRGRSIQGVLLCLADMPFIQTSSYSHLLEALDDQHIIVPTYQGRRANPVAFGRRFFDELAALSEDVGGKSILQAHPDRVRELEIGDPGLIADVDTPQELLTYQSELLP